MLRGARRLGRPALAAAAAFAGHSLSVRRLPRCDNAANLDGPIPAKLDDPEAIRSFGNLARAHPGGARRVREARRGDSERELKAALEEAAHFGAQSAPVATSLLGLAQLCRRSKRWARGAAALRAFTVLEMRAGPRNEVTLAALVDLAELRLERGAAAAAAETFDDALARLSTAEAQQAHGAAPLRSVRAGCLLRASQAEQRLGRSDRAESHLKEALALSEERWGADSPRLVAPCAELARLALAQRRFARPPPGASARAVAQHPQQIARLGTLADQIAAAAAWLQIIMWQEDTTHSTRHVSTPRLGLAAARRGGGLAMAFATAGRFAFAAAAGRFGGEAAAAAADVFEPYAARRVPRERDAPRLPPGCRGWLRPPARRRGRGRRRRPRRRRG